MTIEERAIGRIERVVWARLPEVGLAAVVAIHSSRLGAALGGLTLLAGTDSADAVVTAMRQAEAATLTAATAGASAGGGAVVVLGEPSDEALTALGDVLDRLGGAMWLVPDLGRAPREGRAVAAATRYSADPDPLEGAAGIVLAARGAWREVTGRPTLAAARVRLLADGPLARAVRDLARADGARVEMADAVDHGAPPADLVIACAPGVLSEADTSLLRCRVAIGAPGDPLDSEAVWEAMSARGVLAVPGTIAGGALVQAAAGRAGRLDEAAR